MNEVEKEVGKEAESKEEVIKKLQEILADESKGPRIQKRAEIVLAYLNGKTEEDLILEQYAAKVTIVKILERYKAEGLRCLYDNGPDGTKKRKPAQTYEKTYPCSLGLSGPDPTLLELYIDDSLMIAAFRMDAPLHYASEGEGTITVKGKPMTERLDKWMEKGELSLSDALDLLRKQTYKIRSFSYFALGLRELLEDFSAHYPGTLGNVRMIAYCRYSYDSMNEFDLYILRNYPYVFEWLETKELWIKRVRELLSHQKKVGSSSLDEILSKMSSYFRLRGEDTLPFIWHSAPGKVTGAENLEPDRTKSNATVDATKKSFTLPLVVEMPEMKPGEGLVVLSATFLEPGKKGSGTISARSVTASSGVPLFSAEGAGGEFFGIINQAERYSSQVKQVLDNLSQDLTAKAGRESLIHALGLLGIHAK